MRSLIVGTFAALLALSLATPAFAACTNAKCTDSAAIETARAMIQSTCGCTRTGQTHGKYVKCVKGALKLADVTALIPDNACRKLIKKCESGSICGKPDAAVCCVRKPSGAVKTSIVGSPTKCKKGSACGAMLGLYSTADACDAADGTCAGPPTPAAGLKGALPPTPGRFNYNLMLGLPGANAACATRFAGTHACTYAELQAAQTAGDLAGLQDINHDPVTSFWAIDPNAPALQQCQDDVAGGSGLNWEYATAHTMSRGQKVTLDNAAGTLGALQTSIQCNLSGNSSVGCCQ